MQKPKVKVFKIEVLGHFSSWIGQISMHNFFPEMDRIIFMPHLVYRAYKEDSVSYFLANSFIAGKIPFLT